MGDLAMDAIQDPGFTYLVCQLAVVFNNPHPQMLTLLRRIVIGFMMASFWIPFVIGSFMIPGNPWAGAFSYGSFSAIAVTLLAAFVQLIAKTIVNWDDDRVRRLDVLLQMENAWGYDHDLYDPQEQDMYPDGRAYEQMMPVNRLPPLGIRAVRPLVRAPGARVAPQLPELPAGSSFASSPHSPKSFASQESMDEPCAPRSLGATKIMNHQQGLIAILVSVVLFLLVLYLMVFMRASWQYVFYILWMPAMLILALGLMALLPLNGCFLLVVIMYFVVGTALVSGMSVMNTGPPEVCHHFPNEDQCIRDGICTWDATLSTCKQAHLMVGHTDSVNIPAFWGTRAQNSIEYPVCKMRWSHENSIPQYVMESAPGVFQRQWSKAQVVMDCNSWTPSISMRSEQEVVVV